MEEIKDIHKSEEIMPKKYRHFSIILYSDSTIYNFKEVLSDLKGSFKDWAYIRHLPEKEEKKEHYHFNLHLENARSLESLSKRLGIPSNYIKVIKSVRLMDRYLIHIDDEEKRQYNLTDVKVSNHYSSKYFSSFDDLKSEQDIIDDIYNFIDTLDLNDYRLCLRYLVSYVNSCGYDKIYKRYRNEFISYLKLTWHNYIFTLLLY